MASYWAKIKFKRHRNYVQIIPIAHLVRDTTAVARVPFYTGAISNIGIMLWCATIAICLFTSAVIRKSNRVKSEMACFLKSAGFFTFYLMLDDTFLFHEKVFPTFIGLSNTVVFTLIAIAASIFILSFIKIIFTTNYILFFFGIGLLSTSVVCDKIHDYGLFYLLDINSSGVKYMLEDGFKLFGITGWFSYFTLTCFEALSRKT